MTHTRNNIEKDTRKWRLSHEANLLLRELAKQQGLEIPQFLEVLSRDLGHERLSHEQLASIQHEAMRIAEERRQAAQPSDA